MLNRGLNVPKWFDAELMRIERGIPRMKRTGHAPNLHGRAEAMLNEVDDFLMPDDIRWCPVDTSFAEPKVTPVKVKNKAVGKGIGGNNTAARDGETKSSMPPMASAAAHMKGNQSEHEGKSLYGGQRKFPSHKEEGRPTRPGAAQKAAPRRARSKSVDRSQRKRQDANVKAKPAGRGPRPKSSSASRGSSTGESSSQSSQSKGQVPRAPPVSSAQPRPPVPPENGPVRPAQRKPQPPPKSAKAVLEGQLKAMQNRNRKNQEKIRATKAEFEKVRVEQKELEKKLYSDLREHLKSGEERRSRPRPSSSSTSSSSSSSRPTRPKTANSAFAKAAADDDDDIDSNDSEEGDIKSRQQQQPNQQTFERHVSTAASRNRSMQRCSNCKRVFRSVAALAMHRTTCDLAKQHGIEFNSNKGAQQAKVDDSDPVGRHRSGSSSGESNDSGARGMPEYDPQQDDRKGSAPLDPEEEEKRRWQERFREWRGKKADSGSDGTAFAGKVPMNEFYMRNYGPWSSENYDGDEKEREEARKKAAADVERIRVEKLRVQEEERARKDLENDKMVLAMHAMRWKEFAAKAKQGRPIGYGDVPWLPTLSRHVSSSRKDKVELFDVIGVPENAPEREKKAALRAASLRWHPDKFRQAYGKLLIDSESERIMDQVNVMSQRINQLKARFDARGGT